ncbi:cytochrome P450 [Parafrankia sp. FMc6]|uniref:cytochrome P450 n=1 Tax=Parafrankia soli TaxID=2599596 RepID=UPI0034D4867C
MTTAREPARESLREPAREPARESVRGSARELAREPAGAARERPPGGRTPPCHLGEAQFQGGPARAYRDLRREHGAVAPVLLDGGLPAWLVLGYRELHYVLSHPEIFAHDPRHWAGWDDVPPDWAALPGVGHRPSVLRAEGAEHRRRYTAIQDVLGAVDLFELRARAEEITDDVIDAFAGRGETDLIDSFAHRVPALVLASLCGPPEVDTAGLVHDLIVLIDDGPDAAESHQRVLDRLRWLLADRREHPDDDIVSRLIAHPAGLADEEVVEDLAVVFGFGARAVAGWIGNSLRLLLTDGSFALDLSGGRRSVMQALNQVLWEDTPMQVVAGRWATRNTQLGGQRIEAGDMIALGLGAGNADPQVRRGHAPDTQTGPGTSANSAHLSFGHGEHRCPYPAQEIAEVVTRTAVEALLDRLPNMWIAVPADALGWRRTAWNRALTALPVRFSPV